MTENKSEVLLAEIQKDTESFHPGFSVNCVIFGYFEKKLKILLVNYKEFDFWMLPGSFVFKDENVDDTTLRIVYELTGIKNAYSQQFYLFGDSKRRMGLQKEAQATYKNVSGININNELWLNDRFITLGYYALVDYTKANVVASNENRRVEWKDFDSELPIYVDHDEIIKKVIDTIRIQSDKLPLGEALLPDKFTLSELRVLYEAILGKPLNPLYFERKIRSAKDSQEKQNIRYI